MIRCVHSIGTFSVFWKRFPNLILFLNVQIPQRFRYQCELPLQTRRCPLWLSHSWLVHSFRSTPRRAEFQSALGMSNSTFVDQLFAVFDENGDAAINFTEFLTILSVTPAEDLTRSLVQLLWYKWIEWSYVRRVILKGFSCQSNPSMNPPYFFFHCATLLHFSIHYRRFYPPRHRHRKSWKCPSKFTTWMATAKLGTIVRWRKVFILVGGLSDCTKVEGKIAVPNVVFLTFYTLQTTLCPYLKY